MDHGGIVRFILRLRLDQVCTKNEVGHISITAKQSYKFTEITTAEGNINAAQQAGILTWLETFLPISGDRQGYFCSPAYK